MVLTTEARLELAAQLFLTVKSNVMCSINNVLRCIQFGQNVILFVIGL